MKKIIIFLTLILIALPIKIKATTAVVDYQEGIYSNRESWNHSYNGKLGYIYLNNQIAYCLNPFKIIGSEYNVDNSVLSSINLDYTKLVTHYGYATHLDNIYYYMATQELIWYENSAVVRIFWTTEGSASSNRIAIDIYKQEILDKVNKARVKPNFNIDNVVGDYGEIIELDDTNEVLSDYDIINESKNEIWKENNKLFIKILDLNNTNIKFIKKIKSGVSTTGYSPTTTSQTLATFSIDETIESSLKVTPNEYNSKIKITRYANNKVVNGKIKFKIFNVKTSQFIKVNDSEIFETDDHGNFISDFKLDIGTYEIFNIEIPDNYIFYDINTSFQIKDNNLLNDNIYEIIDYLDVPYGILNVSENTIYSNYKIPITSDKLFLYANQNIYDENYNLVYYKNTLVTQLITDSNGLINYKLPLGKYLLIDSEFNQYEINLNYFDKYTKEIKQNIDIEKKINSSNINIEVNLKECINDKCLLSKLNDLTYDIYANEDIYINDKLIFKKDEFIYKIYSNNIKEITLPCGSYYIVENDNKYEEKFANYYFNYDGSDISLKITKNIVFNDNLSDDNKDENNEIIENPNKEVDNTSNQSSNNLELNNYKLPNTSNYLNQYYLLSISLIIIGLLFKTIYEIIKKR